MNGEATWITHLLHCGGVLEGWLYGSWLPILQCSWLTLSLSQSAAGMAFQMFCCIAPCCLVQLFCKCLVLFPPHRCNVWIKTIEIGRWLCHNMEWRLTMLHLSTLMGLDQVSRTSSSQNQTLTDGCDNWLLSSIHCSKEQDKGLMLTVMQTHQRWLYLHATSNTFMKNTRWLVGMM